VGLHGTLFGDVSERCLMSSASSAVARAVRGVAERVLECGGSSGVYFRRGFGEPPRTPIMGPLCGLCGQTPGLTGHMPE
jgi:hypothetical protein